MSRDVQAFVFENRSDTWVLPASVKPQNERKMEEEGTRKQKRQAGTNKHAHSAEVMPSTRTSWAYNNCRLAASLGFSSH